MILPAIVLTTAIILTSLFWAQWQQWQEKRRRRQGAYSLAIDKGYIAIAGCLGVFGYLGLLFITLWLTFDIVEEATAPGWLNFGKLRPASVHSLPVGPGCCAVRH